MSTLLVDIGNSRIKWALLDTRGVCAMHVIEERAATAVRWARRLLREAGGRAGGIESIVAVNVAGPAAARRLTAAARAAGLSAPSFAASAKRAAGVVNGYAQPWRLGADRWVALIAAHHLAGGARPACVIDAGTALTIDLVDRAGRHRGGLIAPGAQLMVDSLLRNTQGIRRRTAGTGRTSTRAFFARNTRAGLQQGAIQGSAALIDRAITEAAALLGGRPLVLLTGGGAPVLHPWVTARHRLVPDLVLQGLAVLAAARL